MPTGYVHGWTTWCYPLRDSVRRGLAGYQHRARCRADHLFRHTAQEDMGQASTTVGPHYNEIHLSRRARSQGRHP